MADKIKEMLEEALRKGNKTPKQVADYLHISLSTFSRMRNNPLDASVRNLYNYVVYLGIPSQKIFDILGYGHYLKIPMSISFECQTQEEFQELTEVIQQFNKKKQMNCNSEISEESLGQSLHNIQERLGEIHAFIKDMKNEYAQIDGTIEMDRHLMERLFNVSESTLYRWRHASEGHNLPYHLHDDGSTYYLFEDVYLALKKDKSWGRGSIVLRLCKG